MLVAERVVLTDHLYNMIHERIPTSYFMPKKVILNHITNGVQPTETQIRKHFAYTDNTGKYIVYSKILRAFFVLKNENDKVITITCIKEK